jgi:hypothetical protein
MRHRDAVRELLKGFIHDYDKHVDYTVLSPGYPEAARRARKLDEIAANAQTPGHNPTTGVYLLTESIRSNA